MNKKPSRETLKRQLEYWKSCCEKHPYNQSAKCQQAYEQIKLLIENQPRVSREALRLLDCPKCGRLEEKEVTCSWCGKRIRIDD